MVSLNKAKKLARPPIHLQKTSSAHATNASSSKLQTNTMAASMFAQACDALVRERDRVFLERIAHDYNLNLEELNAKYLECSEAAIKVPRKYTKKPKAVDMTVEDKEPKAKEPKAPKEKTCCTAQTSKKEPCKFSALKGEVFCLRHLKQSRGEVADPKPAKPKKEAKADPIHTHPIDRKADEPCETCDKYGEPMAPTPVEFEKVLPKTAAERLAEMLEEADSDSESDSEAGEMVEFEEYEEEM